jgi:glutathione S-transferase/GST-like protein
MHTLYWSAESGAFVVQAVLEELGLPYCREIVSTAKGEHRTPAFLALNPMAQVPVLRLPDGTVLTESAAMVVHLCDTCTEAGLLPAPGTSERAVAYRWLFWLATGLYESDLRYYYPDRYTADPAGADGVRAAALERMDRLLAIAEGLIARPYALGERFSAVDLYLFMLALWHPEPVAAVARHAGLAELVRMVRQRPAVERIWWQNHPAEAVP